MAVKELQRQSLTARYLTLSTGEAFSKVCVLLAFAYLARVLGPHDFGLVELSLSVTLMCALAVEGGLGSYGARIVAAAPERAGQLVAAVVALRTMLALPAYAIILVLSARYGQPGVGVLAIYGLTVLLVPGFLQWVFQGLGRMRWVAGVTAARNFVFTAGVFLFVRPGSDPRWVAVAEVLGVATLATLNVLLLSRVLRLRVHWRGAWGQAVALFREAWSLGASELTWIVLWYSPTVVLGAIREPTDVAWLAGALRIVLALHTFVWLYFFNLLPGLSKAYVDGVDAWRELANRSLSASMWLACLVPVGVTLLAPILIATVYGSAYTDAVLPLRIVIWMIPIAWLSGHFRYTLIATGHQRSEFAGAAAAAAVCLGVAVALSGRLGAEGAALALVAGGSVNAALTGIAMKRHVGHLDVVSATLSPASVGVLCTAAGLVVAGVAGQVAAAALAFAVYGTIAMRRNGELVRLRQAWLGR